MGLEKINIIRRELGLSLDELSESSGVPMGTLSKITAGITKDPKLQTLVAIARALHCTLNDLDDSTPSKVREAPEINYVLAGKISRLTPIDKIRLEAYIDGMLSCGNTETV